MVVLDWRMPRKNLNVDAGIEGQGKVRKRRSSQSSPPSSSIIRNHRLKRAILVEKRGGGLSSIPVQILRMTSKSSSFLNEKSVALNCFEKGQESSVSVRKLAATLWEFNGAVTPKLQDNVDAAGKESSGIENVRKDKILKESHFQSMETYLFDAPQAMDRPDLNAPQTRNSVCSQKNIPLRLNVGDSNSLKKGAVIEELVGNHRVKNRLKELVGALTTSKELLKVLSHIYLVEDQKPTNLALLSALKTELDRACIQVNKLIHDRKYNEQLMEHLLSQFEVEKANWKIREKERVQSAIRSMAREYQVEKKLKRQTERLNQKLGEELADTKAKLEREIRANDILQRVCDELDTEMGKDRAKVEQIKRESAKVRAEVEKEREMLQLADILREERVQMKLLEAKYQYEEKNAAVDNLKNELEAYLSTKVDEEQVDGSQNYDKIKELENYLRETLPAVPCEYQNQEDENSSEAGSDLHSFELNADDIIGRKPIYEKVARQSITFGRQEFSSPNRRKTSVDGKGSFEIFSEAWKKGSEDDEIERYNMIKDLRDHIVSGYKMEAPYKEVSIPIDK